MSAIRVELDWVQSRLTLILRLVQSILLYHIYIWPPEFKVEPDLDSTWVFKTQAQAQLVPLKSRPNFTFGSARSSELVC